MVVTFIVDPHVSHINGIINFFIKKCAGEEEALPGSCTHSATPCYPPYRNTSEATASQSRMHAFAF